MATACELAGTGLGKAKTDGISYLPTLLGKPEKQVQPEYRYYVWGSAKAVRVGNWKLIVHGGGKRIELFNLKTDIGEQNNVAEQHPDIVARLKPYLEKAVQPL